jgi:hypothetical protein
VFTDGLVPILRITEMISSSLRFAVLSMASEAHAPRNVEEYASDCRFVVVNATDEP